MVPTLPERPDVAIHCAGSEDDATLNDRLGRGFLDAVAAVAPKAVLLVSSWQVYSADAGEGVDETRPLWASTEVGRSKARMERSSAMPRGWLEFRWPWCARRVCSAPE